MAARARRLVLFVVAVAGALALPVAAEIKKESFREDPRSSIMFEKFGFSKPGAVRIIVSGAAVSSPVVRPDNGQLGFFLLSDEWGDLIGDKAQGSAMSDPPAKSLSLTLL